MIMFLFGMSLCVYMVIFAYDQFYFGVCMCVYTCWCPCLVLFEYLGEE